MHAPQSGTAGWVGKPTPSLIFCFHLHQLLTGRPPTGSASSVHVRSVSTADNHFKTWFGSTYVRLRGSEASGGNGYARQWHIRQTWASGSQQVQGRAAASNMIMSLR